MEQKTMTVLVADDFTDGREMIVAFFEQLGFRVFAARDGAEAVTIAGRELPDAIVMDVSMPGVDGIAATRLLKATERTRSIPVIACSGHAFQETEREAREAGCDAFLTKPCLPDVLVDTIRQLLQGGETRPDKLLDLARRQR